jgi:SAM-dependent methyltransferase
MTIAETSTASVNQRWSRYCNGLAEEAAALIIDSHQYLQPVEVCPVCKTKSQAPSFEKHSFFYVICPNCDLVYMNPRPTPQLLARFYNDLPIRKFFFEHILLDFAEADQTSFFMRRLSRLEQLHQGDRRRLLDVGCAAGYFVLLAQQQGWQGVGLELNEAYVAYAKEKRNLNIRQQTLTEFAKTGAKFDIITVWDVLEHVTEPLEIFETTSYLLEPGGLLAFSTINHRTLNAKVLKQDWRYYLPPDHLYSFTPKLLKQILARYGFTVERIEHQYMLEVFIEGINRRGVSIVDPRNLLPNIIYALGQQPGVWNKIKKLALIGANFASLGVIGAMERILELMEQGDLITIYARRQGQP